MSRALTVMLVLVQAALVLGAACTDSSGAPMAGAPGGAEGGAAGDPGGVGGESNDGTGGLAGGGGGGGGAPWTEARLRLPPEHAWLDDPAVWKLLPDDDRFPWSSKCALFEGQPEHLKFPKLQWEPCGAACDRADVVQGFGTSSFNTRVGTEGSNEKYEPFVALLHAVYNAADGVLGVLRLVSLERGETDAAISVRIGRGYNCPPILEYGSVLSIGHIRPEGPAGSEGRSFRIDGTWDPSSRSWNWRLPWTDLADEVFKAHLCDEFAMTKGGRFFYVCGSGSLWASLEPGSSEPTLLFDNSTSNYNVLHGAALGDLAVWSERFSQRDDLHSRIRAWKPDDLGIRTLIERIPGVICEVALSDKHFAGYLAESCGQYGYGARVVVAPLNDDSTVGELRTSPPLTDISIGVGEIKTGGDFIAVRALAAKWETLTEKSPVFLIRTTDWAVRLVDYLPESQAKSITLSDDYLYVVHGTNRADPDIDATSHVYRYDLSRFDELGTLIEPPDDAVAEP